MPHFIFKFWWHFNYVFFFKKGNHFHFSRRTIIIVWIKNLVLFFFLSKIILILILFLESNWDWIFICNICRPYVYIIEKLHIYLLHYLSFWLTRIKKEKKKWFSKKKNKKVSSHLKISWETYFSKWCPLKFPNAYRLGCHFHLPFTYSMHFIHLKKES